MTAEFQLTSPAEGAKPFVKWAGGKQSLVRVLTSKFPTTFARYYEPFAGGGSIFFHLEPHRAVLSDENVWLIDTYRGLATDWKEVAHLLDGLRNTKEEYLRIRRVKFQDLDLFARAAHLIYLNKTCFRGLFRVNREGQFNVPYGEYQRAYYDRRNLAAVARALREVELRQGDFEFGIDGAKSDDFIYFDPPYYKLGGYSDFNRYTSSQFREKDHLRLAALCRELDHQGIRWALSNSDTGFVRSLFAGFRLVGVSARREINLNSQERDVNELLILNY